MTHYINVHRDDLRAILRLAEDGLTGGSDVTAKADEMIWERLMRRLNETIPSDEHYADCVCSGCIERRRLDWRAEHHIANCGCAVCVEREEADRVTAQGIEDAQLEDGVRAPKGMNWFRGIGGGA